MKHWHKLFVTTLAAGSLMGVPAYAQNDTADRQRSTLEQKQQQPHLQAAASLIGRSVQTTDGNDLGDIEDIVLTSQGDRIAYMVLASGGFLGLGQNLYAVPFQAFDGLGSDGDIVLNITERDLKDAPGFKRSNWPDVANENWQSYNNRAWGVEATQSRYSNDRMDAGEMRGDNQSRDRQDYRSANRDNRDDFQADSRRSRDRAASSRDRDMRSDREGERFSSTDGSLKYRHAQTRDKREYDRSERYGNADDDNFRATDMNRKYRRAQVRDSNNSRDRNMSNRDDSRSRDMRNRDDFAQRSDRDMARDRRATQDRFWTRRLSDLIGLQARMEGKDDAGELEDILIDIREGRAAYAILSLDELDEINKDNTIVPWQRISVMPRERAIFVDATVNQLKSSAFARNNGPNTQDRAAMESVSRSYDEEPYWVLFGYIPAESYDSRTWSENSPVNREFDPNTLQTYKGTVQSVGVFSLDTTSEPGRRLRIETQDGQVHTVYTGPRSWYERQNVALRRGDAITITGAEATIDGRNVILAGEITARDEDGNQRTMTLRDKQGNPTWKTIQSERSSRPANNN